MNYEEFNAWSFSAKGQNGYLDNELTEVGLATTFLKPASSSSKGSATFLFRQNKL